MFTPRKLCAAGAAMLCALLLAACGSGAGVGETVSAQPPAGAARTINGAGSTFVSPLMNRWIADYGRDRSGAAFAYEAVGSGEGIERFIAGGVDFAASDAAMNDAEIARVQPPSGRGVTLIPVTAGEVVVAYNIPGLQRQLRLPREVYADIFLGRISHWNDARIVAANPDARLPAKRIQVVARRDSSGTTFAFTNHLSTISENWRNGPGAGKSVAWPAGTMIALGNEGVAQRLKITQYAIGYLEYGFARRLGLPMAALQNRAGAFVAPGAAGGAAALDVAPQSIPADLRLFLPDPAGVDAYPMVSLVWVLLRGSYADTAAGYDLNQAVNWALGPGQAVAEEMGYIPLPESLVARARQVLDGDS